MTPPTLEPGTPAAAGKVPAGNRALALVLVLLMALGSILMWLVSPVGWLWIASQLVSTQAPTLGGYAIAFFGMIATFIVLAKVLARLDHWHTALVRPPDGRRRQTAWLRSMRGEREPGEHDKSILNIVMIVSVALAAGASGLWFLLFAGSSLPGQ